VTLLYFYFGWGFSVALLIVFGMMVLNFCLAKVTARMTKRVMGAKDN